MMLEDALRKGFALAHQRLGFVFIDIVWKIIWVAATAAGLLLIAAWFGSDLRGLAWQETGVRAANITIASVAAPARPTENRMIPANPRTAAFVAPEARKTLVFGLITIRERK